MSSSAGPSRVNRPRKSSASISNGSAASSMGTADGARTGAEGVILMSVDCEDMALYLGSGNENRKGSFVSRTRCSVLHAAPQCRDPIFCAVAWTPDQQRTTPQEGRAA